MNRKLLLFTLLLMITSVMKAQSFQSFKHEPISSSIIASEFIVNGMSSDGKYVVGYISNTANANMMPIEYLHSYYSFTWTKEDGLKDWDSNARDAAGMGAIATNASPSGKIIGISPNPDLPTTYAYTDWGGTWEEYDIDVHVPSAAYYQYGVEAWSSLPVYKPGVDFSYTIQADVPKAVTDDGSIVVGGFKPARARPQVAGYWKFTDDGIEKVALLEESTVGNVGSMVNAVSGDGKVMGGYNCSENGYLRLPVLWIDGEYIDLSYIGEGQVVAISNNGKYAALNIEYSITAIEPGIRGAIYDIEEGTYRYLENDNKRISVATGISDNGIVVGYRGTVNSNGQVVNRTAFAYTSSRGIIALTDILESSLYPANFVFNVAAAISADGHIISGYGKESGKEVGFYIEIPEIEEGVYGVDEFQVVAPTYGVVTISWEQPQENKFSIPLTGYEVYRNNELNEVVDADITSYQDEVEDGIYTYYIKALYEEGEAVASSTKQVVMGRLELPYFDTFDDYTYNSGESLSTVRFWDISFNSIPSGDSWLPKTSGYPPNCVQFQVPSGGDYEETLTTAFIDASDLTSLQVNFVMIVSSFGSTHSLSVEIYDGENWHTLETFSNANLTPVDWSPYRYDVTSIAAGKENVRVRFRVHGSGDGNRTQWIIDNLEITDNESALVHSAPLAVQVTEDHDNGSVIVSWVSPEETAVLRYVDTADWTASMIGNEGEPIIGANMFPAEEMKIYDDYWITHLSFMPSEYPYDKDQDGNPIVDKQPAQYKWYISQGEGRLCEEEITDVEVNIDMEDRDSFTWVTRALTTPIQIDGNKPLYYGVEVTFHEEYDLPLATSDILHIEYYQAPTGTMSRQVSENAADGRANIYSEDGGETWKTLNFYYDNEHANRVYPLFNVSATLAKEPSAESTLSHFSSYKVIRNGVNLITERFNSATSKHTRKNVIVDFNPPAEGAEACYEVYAHYISAYDSKPIQKCITVTITDIQSYEKDGNGISVYPSPVVKGQSINIDLGAEEAEYKGDIKIYNSTGSLVQETPIVDRITTLNINLPAGVYFVKVNNEVLKIVVE